MRPADSWAYEGYDGCAEFFGQCLRQANPEIPPDARVLEIGCSEFNWLTPASQCWPEMTFTGVDWRAHNAQPFPNVTRMKADIRDPALFAPASFDWIVSISAIEHVGLGHYQQDPLDTHGDTVAITNALHWLKPGGWLLFDVPYDPTGYRKIGTECRVYDDAAIWARLWVEPLAAAKASAQWHGTWYAKARRGQELIEKPTKPCDPFYYSGFAWQKVR